MLETNFIDTEIGSVPKDWSVVTLGEISKDMSYGVAAEAIAFDGKNRYLRITDISDDNGAFKPNPITSPSFFSQEYIVKENDLLVARTGATVGKTYLYNPKDGRLVYAGFLIKANVCEADGRYVFYFTQTSKYKMWVLSESMRSGQPGINAQQLKSLKLPLPPLPEQRRIASALTSIDGLISALDNLIQKKQAIKTGIMQELLSGKRRLEGFREEWKSVRFDDIFECVNARKHQLKTSEYCHFGKTKIIDQGKEDIVGYSNNPNPFVCPENGVIIFGDHTRIFKISKEDFFVGADGVQVLHCIESDATFLYYYCLTLDIPSTGYNRHFKYLKDSMFFIPTSLPEQCAIASVLTAMDDELAALEVKKAKYVALKQGMMQQLLTGKIRLIDSVAK